MSVRARVQDWADPVVGATRERPRVAGAILLVVGLLLVVSGYLGRIPFLPQGGTTVTMEVSDSSLLASGSLVRVKGVDVGEVTAVRHVRVGAPAVVELRVEDDVARTLRRDAGAEVWWRTLFGGRSYVELRPGLARAPLQGTIPVSRTSVQVEFDTLLRTLDDRARPAVATALRELRRGFADPAAVARMVERAPGAARAAAPALRALRGTWSGDLTRLVQRTARMAGAVARDEEALARLLDGAELTFTATAARRADLAAALRTIPAAAQRVRAEAAALPRTLDRLDPVVDGALPAARRLDAANRALQPAAAQLRRTLRTARPLLADLRPAARALGAAGTAGAPLVRDLTPTVTRLRREIVPWLRERDPISGIEVGQLLGPTLAGHDAVATTYDVHGNGVRIAPSVGLNSIGPLPCETYLFEPGTRARVVCNQLSGLLRGMQRAMSRRAKP
ncbi:MAG TPA: MlaD family protein [Baekduia sp.]|nr:MlaD family protein [Baekduia sp.]